MALGAFLLAAFAQSSLLVGGLIVYPFRFSAKVIGALPHSAVVTSYTPVAARGMDVRLS